MSNTQPRYYELKPISEKPEKGTYNVIDVVRAMYYKATYYPSLDQWMIEIEYDEPPNGIRQTHTTVCPTHYLSPVASPSPVNGWVKVSERLPELPTGVEFCIRHLAKEGYRYKPAYRDGFGLIRFAFGGGLVSGDFEWLDESASPTPEAGEVERLMEENERLWEEIESLRSVVYNKPE
jgi:hypothetical protein